MIPKLSNISFKSIPIYDVKVKKKEGSVYKNVDATFSRLNPYDNKDAAAINKIRKQWGVSGYTEEITNNFKHPGVADLFFAIELKGDEPLHKRIVSISETCPSMPSHHIDFLQSRPKNYLDIKEGDIKGGGEVMLYGIIKASKVNCFDRVNLRSTYRSVDFYKHVGFSSEEDERTCMELKNSDFDSYIKRVEEKYGFNQEEEQ